MRKGIQTVIVGGVLALLSACSQPAIPTPTTDSMAQMVQIGPGDTPAAIEQSYGGHVVVWQPEAQTAILEVAAGHTQGLTTAAQHSEVIASEPNTNAILVPEHNHDTPGLSTQGWTAWSGGYTAWSGGYTAWSGGWTAWSGGTAEGSESPNREAWQQIGLYDTDGLAPHYGAGITVAVIDTGIDLRHPMFQGHLAPGHDFVDDDPEPQEVPAPEGQRSGYGHGTAVAGIILQVAPNATILPLRVLRPDGSGDLTAVIAAIDWAMNAGVDVINLSLGAQRHSPSLQFMIDQATQEG
ncbi:MAG TPA: S8 family serine peptidase, partial [Trueperaceae bacterium]